jgi:hypothetical protein
MPDINRSKVIVDFKDIYGHTISDDVEIKIYNTQLMDLKQRFDVTFKGLPVRLTSVPAYPTGHAQLIVTPTKYRFKQRFINVQAGKDNEITEYFFVDPSHADPHPIAYADLPEKSYGEKLLKILDASKIKSTVWNKLDRSIRASILNLSAKLSKERVDDAPLIDFIEQIDRTWLDLKHRERIYARVSADLLPGVISNPQIYHRVSGGMHKFPTEDWKSVPKPDSFKTLKDSAGNIQLTFAMNMAEDFLSDIDLDDHTGLAHVADVLKHKFSGQDTHPYDIHQILWFSQQLDAEYRLL